MANLPLPGARKLTALGPRRSVAGRTPSASPFALDDVIERDVEIAGAARAPQAGAQRAFRSIEHAGDLRALALTAGRRVARRKRALKFCTAILACNLPIGSMKLFDAAS